MAWSLYWSIAWSPPAMTGRIAEHAAGFFDREQRFEFAELVGDLCHWKMSGHQIATWRSHQRVSGRDRKDFGAGDVGFDAETAGLRDIAGIDPAPEVPPAQCWIGPKGGDRRIILLLENIGDTQADENSTRIPAIHLAGCAFA